MKFFIDECLSPRLAHRLSDQGYDAVATRDVGRLGERDDAVRDRCIAEDRIIVTHNAGDFRKLLGRVEMHPGLIILPESAAEPSIQHMGTALRYVGGRARGDPRKLMVNRIVEVRQDGRIVAAELPPA